MGDKYMTGSDRLFEKLKNVLCKAGSKAVESFTKRTVSLHNEEYMGQLIDEARESMTKEQFHEFLKQYGLMPYYTYTGPTDTREEDWMDLKAYEKKVRKTPTGAIHLVHPEIEMLCRVTDGPELPGFIIACKDEAGTKREIHIYLSGNGCLRVCTSHETDIHLSEEEKIRKDYQLPFKNTDGSRPFWIQKGETTKHYCEMEKNL